MPNMQKELYQPKNHHDEAAYENGTRRDARGSRMQRLWEKVSTESGPKGTSEGKLRWRKIVRRGTETKRNGLGLEGGAEDS